MKNIGNRHRRGMSLLYAPVAMMVMVAACLLAIDYGRAQLVKSELQQAADAAALAGVSRLSAGGDQAHAQAMTAASYNRSEGQPITLADGDVRVGKWNDALSTFEATEAAPDAVQVTVQRTEEQENPVGLLFGSGFQHYTADVSVTAVARLTGSKDPGFVGIEKIEAKNNALLMYDSSQDASCESNPMGSAVLGSNGPITFKKLPQGDAVVVLGPDGSYTGKATYLEKPLSYPPTETPPVPSKGMLNVAQAMVHPAGTYYYTSISFANNVQLRFAGPATIYVRDRITFQQGNAIVAFGAIPSNLQIRIIGGTSSYVGGDNANNVDITAEVYAPNTDLISKNNAYLRGKGIFRSMVAKNNLELYTDRASIKPGVSLVR